MTDLDNIIQLRFVNREEWTQHAACRGMDADLFFPTRGGDTATAKQVCAGCPVRDACLDCAIRNNEQYGVWGGLSERERRRLRQRRQRLTPDDPGFHGRVVTYVYHGCRCEPCTEAVLTYNRNRTRNERTGGGVA